VWSRVTSLAHCFASQGDAAHDDGSRFEIPIGIGDVGMAQVGAQCDHVLCDGLPVCPALLQRAHCERVAQVVDARPAASEFPQTGTHHQSAIAARIDSAHWGPVFNRFHKRFRIGISSFGRARLIPNEAPAQAGNRRIAFYGDLQPLDIATNPALELRAERNQAGETVLNYRAKRKLRIDYSNFNPGDTVQFIVSTPEAIRAAVHSAREIKGNNAGVVFFRWPAERESWAMQPDEVLDAAGRASSDYLVRPKAPASQPSASRSSGQSDQRNC
jgi:hypothetical protein